MLWISCRKQAGGCSAPYFSVVLWSRLKNKLLECICNAFLIALAGTLRGKRTLFRRLLSGRYQTKFIWVWFYREGNWDWECSNGVYKDRQLRNPVARFTPRSKALRFLLNHTAFFYRLSKVKKLITLIPPKSVPRCLLSRVPIFSQAKPIVWKTEHKAEVSTLFL